MCFKYDIHILTGLVRESSKIGINSVSVLMRFTWIGNADAYAVMRDRRDICSRKKNMAEMYEVFRFIDQGTRCRQSMDYVEGKLLIYYLRDNPESEKAVLFEWFRQIGKNLEQYRRCRNGKGYLYLNPYSIVVTEEERLCLLDPDSPENEAVMKKMQLRAVREHFVKPVLSRKSGDRLSADLFGYGKTMQFMLAYTEPIPRLTRLEEARMMRVIDRCIGNRKKRYEDFRQILRDLPEIHGTGSWRHRRISLLLLCAAAAIPAGIAVHSAAEQKNMETAELQRAAENEKTQRGQSAGTEEVRTAGEDEMTEGVRTAGEGAVTGEVRTAGVDEAAEESHTAEEYADITSKELETLLLENTAEGNERVMAVGQELERNILRSLAAAYEREEMTGEAISAYARLVEIEERSEMIENAGIRKMKLEAGQKQYAAALLTGEGLLEKLGGSEAVQELIEEYKGIQGKGEQDAEQAENQAEEKRQ